MAAEYISPPIREFLKANGCEHLAIHVQSVSYHDFITTPSWNLAQWGAPLECVLNHAELAYEAYQKRVRIGFVGKERGRSVLYNRGRGTVAETRAPTAANPKPVPRQVDELVRKSRAQVLGDRCCAVPRGDRATAYKQQSVPRVLREPSPDPVYRTKAF